MPKRSFDEKMEYYIRKMDKLREKHRHKRQRLQSFSSSDNEIDYDIGQGGETQMWDPTDPQTNSGETIILPDPDAMASTASPATEKLASSVTQQNDPPPGPEEPAFPQLDPEILSALGEATDSGPIWGQDIHDNLSQLWLPLLKKGMDKEAREKVLKQYLTPSNCTLLQAPKLNIEISAAIIEMVRLRDKKIEATQQQLGTGITAISRAMTLLLTNDNKIEAIRTLSDGCRILCDLHHSETQARIKMITPGLAKPFLNVISDSERDETLFGASLPEKIKASKTIEKQGLQIKKSVPPAKSNLAPTTTNPARQQFQGNWTGPSRRYPNNRGGRGGQRRYPSTSSRRPAPSMSAQHRVNHASKSRALPRP